MESLKIERRFRGPNSSGNGGYSCGLAAGQVESTSVTVTLHTPPPIEVDLLVERDGDQIRLMSGESIVADAKPGIVGEPPIAPVTFTDARAAEQRFAGLTNHPFPECFVCGPAREPGDGLRVFPGRVDADRFACGWVPDGSLVTDGHVGREFVWAVLDCVGGWSIDDADQPYVLGRMTGDVVAAPHVGEKCVLMGRFLGEDGRKRFVGSSLYGADGRLLGHSSQVWIAIDIAKFS